MRGAGEAGRAPLTPLPSPSEPTTRGALGFLCLRCNRQPAWWCLCSYPLAAALLQLEQTMRCWADLGQGPVWGESSLPSEPPSKPGLLQAETLQGAGVLIHLAAA